MHVKLQSSIYDVDLIFPFKEITHINLWDYSNMYLLDSKYENSLKCGYVIVGCIITSNYIKSYS